MIISNWKHPEVVVEEEVETLFNSSSGGSSRDPCHPFLLPLLLLPPTTILCTAAAPAVIQVQILCLPPKRWTMKSHKVRRPFTNTIARLRRLLLRRRCRRRLNPFEELATFGMQVLAEEEETIIIETWVAVLALVPVANTTVLAASIHRDPRSTFPRMRSRSHHCRCLEEEKDLRRLFDRTSADRHSGTGTT